MNPIETQRGGAGRAAQALIAVLLAWAGTANADDAGAALTPYGLLYPEWLMQRFGAPSSKGTTVGNLGTLRNDSVTLSSDVRRKADLDDHAWSNSYVGLRGERRGTALTVGYDFQLVIDPAQMLDEKLDTRDAFVYVDSAAGRIAVGKMDSIYKEAGDQVRMLGVSSGNVVSTARVLSGSGWRGQGETTFHNRRSNMVTWFSPSRAGVDAGLSYAIGENGGEGRHSTLAAAALRWTAKPWYLALALEEHRNWLPMSRGATPAATSILNTAATTNSRDRAWRLSFAWTDARWRVGADLARLAYAERDAAERAGKFRGYRNLTWQTSVEYRWNERLRLSANHARASAGECTLSGDVACSTVGLGGNQTSLGALYALNRFAGVFALAVHTRNGAAAVYGSAPRGAQANALAVGVRVAFD